METRNHSIAALLVAAGSGSRLASADEVPKQFRMLAGHTILSRALVPLLAHPAISSIRVVIDPDHASLYGTVLADLSYPLPPWVAGGASRQESVCHGLACLEPLAPDFVLIHDGARPFLDRAVLDRCIEALIGEGVARRPDGVVPGIPVHDSVKRAGVDGLIMDEIAREGLWLAQTPQFFNYSLLREAHIRARREGAAHRFPDDAELAREAGMRIVMVDGAPENFKLTYGSDLRRAEHIVRHDGRENRTPRIGKGFDVHRFVEGGPLKLGGVEIECQWQLDGHSDADVALHALTDAVLGAIGEGDIGHLFPDRDPQWRGADSALFLGEAVARTRRAGGSLVNVDLTIICEKPRIGPHREAMRNRVAAILGLAPQRVNIKATTTEKLGFTGRQEGIAAEAVALVLMPEEKSS